MAIQRALSPLHDLTESIFGDILEENDTEERRNRHRQDGSDVGRGFYEYRMILWKKWVS
ncbi:MAG: hypothetical protein ACLUSK_10555 [Bacteroides stercoris]